MMSRRSFVVLAAAPTLALALAGRATLAQPWPTRPVRFVVPFPAGVAPDVGCRVVAAQLSESWGIRPWWRTSRAPAATSAPKRSPVPPQTGRPC